MEVLERYKAAQDELFAYFGYVEDWRVIPVDDATGYYWELPDGEMNGNVEFADSIEQLEDKDEGDYYSNEIYRQRHLSKWVYRGEDYTMICVDTHTDGNQFLQIFDNSKELR